MKDYQFIATLQPYGTAIKHSINQHSAGNVWFAFFLAVPIPIISFFVALVGRVIIKNCFSFSKTYIARCE